MWGLVDAHASSLAIVNHGGVRGVELHTISSKFIHGYGAVDLGVGTVVQHVLLLHSNAGTGGGGVQADQDGEAVEKAALASGLGMVNNGVQEQGTTEQDS